MVVATVVKLVDVKRTEVEVSVTVSRLVVVTDVDVVVRTVGETVDVEVTVDVVCARYWEQKSVPLRLLRTSSAV